MLTTLRPRNRLLGLGCAVGLLFWWGAGCSKNKALAARVGKQDITRQEIHDMVKRFVAISKKVNQGYQVPVGQGLVDMRKQFLNGLIDKVVILSNVKRLGISVDEQVLSEKIAQLRAGNKIVEESAFTSFLAQQGLTEGDFKKNIRELMLMERARDSLFSEVTVSQEGMQEYFEAHKSDYQKKSIRVAHILLKTENRDSAAIEKLREKIRMVAKKAKAGEDFAGLAKKYSEGPSGPHGGGSGKILERGYGGGI